MYTAFINSGCQVYFIKFSFFRHHFLQITVWIFLGVAVTVIMSIVIMLNFIADRSAKLTCKCCNDHKADQKLSKLPFLFYRSAALLHWRWCITVTLVSCLAVACACGIVARICCRISIPRRIYFSCCRILWRLFCSCFLCIFICILRLTHIFPSHGLSFIRLFRFRMYMCQRFFTGISKCHILIVILWIVKPTLCADISV